MVGVGWGGVGGDVVARVYTGVLELFSITSLYVDYTAWKGDVVTRS